MSVYPQPAEVREWTGVDLDGTLAHYNHETFDPMVVGPPVAMMLDRLKVWIASGRNVKIFTARVTDPKAAPAITKVIQDWCEKHGLPRLEVTNVKDYGMIALWDDRCVTVEMNTGLPLVPPYAYPN